MVRRIVKLAGAAGVLAAVWAAVLAGAPSDKTRRQALWVRAWPPVVATPPRRCAPGDQAGAVSQAHAVHAVGGAAAALVWCRRRPSLSDASGPTSLRSWCGAWSASGATRKRQWPCARQADGPTARLGCCAPPGDGDLGPISGGHACSCCCVHLPQQHLGAESSSTQARRPAVHHRSPGSVMRAVSGRGGASHFGEIGSTPEASPLANLCAS